MRLALVHSIFLSFLYPQISIAEVKSLALVDHQTTYLLGRHLELLKNPREFEQIEEVQKRPKRDFIKKHYDILTFNRDKKTQWMKLSVLNRSTEIEWILSFESPRIDHIQVFVPDANGEFDIKKSRYNISTQ